MVKISEVENETSEETWKKRVDRIGLEVAQRILPRELGVLIRYDRQLLLDLAEAFAVPTDNFETLPERLWEPFAKQYVKLLAEPPGTAVSLLKGLEDTGIEVKAEMFWRSALRLHMNTLQQLEGMATRWSADLEVRVESTPGSSDARRKIQAVSVVLPSFAMVCKTQKEIQESEVRKAGIEKMKKEAADKEAKQQAEREKKQQDPTVSQPVASGSTAPSKAPPQPVQVKARPNETKSSASAKPIEATAARHTYDNYSKWDNVNIEDADLDEVIDYSKPRQQQQKGGGREKSAEEQALDAELSEKLQDPELRKHMMDVLGGQFASSS